MRKKSKSLRVTDKPLYSYWQALYMSFYSSRLYVDVAKRWRGFGVLYLLLVIAIASIPLAARIIFDFRHYFDEQMMLPLKKLPPIYVQNGKVVFDKPMPYFIKNQAGAVVAIIDTTGKVSSINAKYPQLTILITKEKLYFRPPKFHLFFNSPQAVQGEDIYEQPLNKASNEVFDGKAWIKSSGILKLKLMTELLIYPLLMMLIFGVYVGLLLALSFLGQLFALTMFSFKMPYRQAARLFLVGSTAQVAIFFVLLTTNRTIPGAGFFYLILLALYFNYAVLCVKRESSKMVPK